MSDQNIPPRQVTAAYASGSMTVLIWGLTPAATVLAVSEIDAITVGMMRVIIAGLLVLPLAFLFRVRKPVGNRQWALLVFSAVTNMIGFSVFFSLGLKYTSTLHVALIQASIPIYAGLMGAVVDKYWPSLRWWIGVGIAFAGLAILFTANDESAGEAALLGDFYCFLAALCAGAGHVSGGKMAAKIGTLGTSLWGGAFSGLVLIPFLLLAGEFPVWSEVSWSGWSALFYLGIFSSMFSFLFWYKGIALGGIHRIVPLQFVQPLVTFSVGILLFGEVMTVALVIATVAVMGGIALTRKA